MSSTWVRIAVITLIASGCANGSIQVEAPVRAGSDELGSEISADLRDTQRIDVTETQLAITSHHLPTAEPLIASTYRALRQTDGPRDVFVVVGPDHFERCTGSVSTSTRGYATPYGIVSNDQQITDALVAAGASLDNTCVEGEHSISVQAIFIKAAFPDATIVPLLFSSSVNERTVQEMVAALEPFRSRIVVIGSVDFSHYHFVTEAERIDRETEEMLTRADGTSLTLEHTDSPASVRLVLALAHAFGDTHTVIVDHANSVDYTGLQDNTTSYFSVVFDVTSP